jgi:indole-3-glycerol phosphate synthase
MILEKIAISTRELIAQEKQKMSLFEMRTMAEQIKEHMASVSFEAAVGGSQMSFICEVKKASPSKGVIAKQFPYLEIARDYENAGANAISVLTEPHYFMGNNQYLTEIASTVSIPVLRKDFIIDEYQIFQAKTIKADAVLLICALLEPQQLKEYITICDSLSLATLVEAHDEKEVETALTAGARIVGVNNRDLRTFQVDINNCIRLRKYVPSSVLFVAESGIKNSEDIKQLQDAQVNAVLIGETLMRAENKKSKLNELKGIL